MTTGQREPVGPTGLDRLRDLRSRGLLETSYDQVAGLLAEETLTHGGDGASGADGAYGGPYGAALQRAGRLLATLDPDAVLARHPGTPVLTVAVTGQSTVAPVVDPLTAELARHGMLLRPVVGDHGAWLRDLGDPGSPLRTADPDLTLCLLDAETVFAQVPVPWRPSDVERAADEVLKRLASIVDAAPGPLVLNTVPLLRRHTHQLVDHLSRARLSVVWREFNTRLLRLAERTPRLVVVDLEPLVCAGGPAVDERLACYAKAQLSAGLLAGYAREVAHLARALRGMTRKCLVLDLDQTLWDGVLADDGPDGIAAAGTLRGEAFHGFQQGVKQLGAQGVLLAVSSKNDREAVLGVLRGHPDMVLRERDFVRIDADWRPKDRALAETAEDLGIAADALVFADDSPVERAQVRHGVPEAAVVALDEEPALHLTRLLADGWFDTLRLTDEDRARTDAYHSERGRRALRENAGSHEDFLRGLDVAVSLSPPLGHEFARLAQLTQRTNRFNLTGARMGEDELRERAADPGRHLLLAARSSDRFGDDGLVGAVLGHYDGDLLHLDNVWLSCRVLARGIEQACVAAVLAAARVEGLTAVHAVYRPTARNERARDFYPSCGFTIATHGGLEHDEITFGYVLDTVPQAPAHVRIDGIELGRRAGAHH
ncbi:HAD-IIIC family phosphatase [Streptomyces spiralis]|uniref:HAD-IIIC family phosphatase n=1 Tax=Streptomyces spiralis TaxID=66376 RepID=UPI0033ED601E